MDAKDVVKACAEHVQGLLTQHAESINGKYKELSEDFAKLQGKYNDLAQLSAEGLKGAIHAPAAPAAIFAKSVASQLAGHEQLKSWSSGEIDRLSSKLSLKVDIGQAMVSTKSVITNGGDDRMAQYQRDPAIYGLQTRPRWLWQYLQVLEGSGPGVQFLRETGSFVSADLQSSEGTEKKESDYSFELKTLPFETVAHWTQASRQVMADQPALSAFLQERMLEGLYAKLEQQLLGGNGTSPQLSGLTDAGNFTAYSGNSSSDGLTKLDHLRNAIRVLQASNYPAGLFIVHPNDWFDIEVERGTDGQYTWAQPASMLPPTAWGLPVHVTTDMTPGSFICMARDAATIYMRQQGQIFVSDSHEDTFVRNVLTFLCEGRFALIVPRPEAVLYGTYDDVN